MRTMKSVLHLCLITIAAVSAQRNSDLTLRGSRRLQCSSSITRFDIINASTNKKVAEVKDGDTIYLTSLGMSNPQQISVRAVTCGYGIDSVKFIMDNGYYKYVDRRSDYFLCGNYGSDIYACPKMTLGRHTLAVSTHGSRSEEEEESLIGGVETFSFTVAQSDTAAPTPRPSPPPVPSPTPAPVIPPQPSCPIPKFVGGWVDYREYPYYNPESQGAMIGNDLVLLSGFQWNFETTTVEVHALDTTNPTAVWRRMDDAPISVAPGFSHSAQALVGTKLYLCGGYLGPSPGRDFSSCVVYDHSVAPGSGNQWSSIADLPDGRGGSGMIYDKNRNALYFSSGAKRDQGTTNTYDKSDTWMFDLANPSLGWVNKTNMPYMANHMSAVTVKDELGNDRHYFLGGQSGHNEANGNFAYNYEWDSVSESWIRRADMPMTRGHFSSSTRAIGCGFLIAGGTSNGMGKITDISYYDIKTDKWTKIGDLWDTINTPICDIVTYSTGEKWLYCDGHWHGAKRIQIVE